MKRTGLLFGLSLALTCLGACNFTVTSDNQSVSGAGSSMDSSGYVSDASQGSVQTWSHDGHYHWRRFLGEDVYSAKEPHAWDEGHLEGDGSRVYQCRVCGFSAPEGEALSVETEGRLHFQIDEQNKTAILQSCDKDAVMVSIPNEYRGMPVASVAPFAFEGCSKLEYLKVPGSIELFGRQCFADCPALNMLVWENGHKAPEGYDHDLELNWFNGTENVTHLYFDDSLQEIPDVFGRFSNLEEVVLPESLVVANLNFDYDRIQQRLSRRYNGSYYLGSRTNPFFYLYYTNEADGKVTVHQDCKLIGALGIYYNFYLNPIHVTDIVFPKGLRSLGGVFGTRITSVTLPEGLVYLGENAFSECLQLEKVVFPDSLEDVGGPFGENPNLKEVILGENTTSFSGLHESFYAKPKFKYNVSGGQSYIGSRKNPYLFLAKISEDLSDCLIENGCRIIGNELTGEYPTGREPTTYALSSVSIPASVANIASFAFYRFPHLQRVSFAEGSRVKAIADSTFAETPLSSINLPNDLETLGFDAFRKCHALKSIALPDSLKSIDWRCFWGSGLMGQIRLGAKLESIGDGAFTDCRGLQIEIAPGNGRYSFADGELFEAESGRLVYLNQDGSSEDIALSQRIKTIAPYVFGPETPLRTVRMGQNVRVLEERCFADECPVENVEFGPNIESMVGVFFDSPIRKADLSMTKIKSLDSCFTYCPNLEEVILPDGLERLVGEFDDCPNLTGLRLPFSLKEITGCFDDCSKKVFGDTLVLPASLRKGTLPAVENLIVPAEFVAQGETCDPNDVRIGAAKVYYQGTLKDWVKRPIIHVFQGRYDREWENDLNRLFFLDEGGSTEFEEVRYEAFRDEHLRIPEGVTRIPTGCFSYMPIFTEVSIPSGVETVEDRAFYQCANLKRVNLSEGIETIGREAFARCPIDVANFPTSLKTIGSSAFGDTMLGDIVLPSGLTFIATDSFPERYAYYRADTQALYLGNPDNPYLYCIAPRYKNGTSLVVEEGCHIIAQQAFRMAGLETLVVTEGVKSILAEAFGYCESLSEVTLPVSLKEVGDFAFAGIPCTDIRYNGTKAQWQQIALSEKVFKSSQVRRIICADGTISIS